LDNITSGVFILDKEFRLLGFNDAVKKIFKKDEIEVINRF
jgi:PAS domain-containing protein